MSQKHSHLWFNKFLLLCGALLFLAGMIIGYFTVKKPLILNPLSPKQTACTMEAKICPDGSSVGRTGPNCEFVECPTKNKLITYIDPGGMFEFQYPESLNIKTNVLNDGEHKYLSNKSNPHFEIFFSLSYLSQNEDFKLWIQKNSQAYHPDLKFGSIMKTPLVSYTNTYEGYTFDGGTETTAKYVYVRNKNNIISFVLYGGNGTGSSYNEAPGATIVLSEIISSLKFLK